MPKVKNIIQLDDEFNVFKKKNTSKPRKSKKIITKDMIAEAAYYKAELRNFEPGHEEYDWLEAERELNMV